MTMHLRIERLVITGLAPGQNTTKLRQGIEQALADLLTPADLATLHDGRHLNPLRPIALPEMAPHARPEAISRVIRDTLLPQGTTS